AEAANLSGLVPGGRNTSMPDFEARFLAALDDDLDTPQAVGLLASLADGVHADANGAYRAQRALRKWCAYIGLGLESAAA
ncbi:MAG TPA: DALR domain-containing protein, partial [Actinomycetota bacterium]|nr:DALR domain-containing protein [Actinomycetota bacterium]